MARAFIASALVAVAFVAASVVALHVAARTDAVDTSLPAAAARPLPIALPVPPPASAKVAPVQHTREFASVPLRARRSPSHSVAVVKGRRPTRADALVVAPRPAPVAHQVTPPAATATPQAAQKGSEPVQQPSPEQAIEAHLPQVDPVALPAVPHLRLRDRSGAPDQPISR